VGARLGEANVLQAQGDVLAFLDRRDEALARYDQALGLFRAVGDRLGEANVLKAQGDVLAFLDRRDEALARYDQALGLFRAVGARLGEATAQLARSMLLQWQNESLASVTAKGSADYLSSSDSPFLRAFGQLADGWQSAFVGDLSVARDKLDAAAASFESVGRVELAKVAKLLMTATGSDEVNTLDEDFSEAELGELRSGLLGLLAALKQFDSNALLAQFLPITVSICSTLGDLDNVQLCVNEMSRLGIVRAADWEALGDARSALGNETGAAEAYAEAVALAPDQPMLRRNYANSLIALGRLDDAAAQLDAAERLDPASPYLALRRAELAKARGDRPAAARWAQEALRRHGDWDEAQAVLHWAESGESANDN
jgi:tetratricopeptide (TPR) repeat protein